MRMLFAAPILALAAFGCLVLAGCTPADFDQRAFDLVRTCPNVPGDLWREHKTGDLYYGLPHFDMERLAKDADPNQVCR